ncbi:MAG: ATP-binding cassette domain-containing protein [Nitrososphaerales archaeon]
MIEGHAEKKLGSFSLSADLNDGGFVCLSGRNGSGKSCFFRAIAGQLSIDEGFFRIGGREVTRLPVERRGVVLVTPGSSIPHLGVEAHLRWGARLRGVALSDDRVSSVRAELGVEFEGRVRTLSLGMRERVSLATALLASPAAILVDEAFANLHERDGFMSSYRRLTSEAGVDVVFSTQDEADGRLADHLYLMREGRTEKRF